MTESANIALPTEAPTSKTCRVCRQARALAEFANIRVNKDGKSGACKACSKKRCAGTGCKQTPISGGMCRRHIIASRDGIDTSQPFCDVHGCLSTATDGSELCAMHRARIAEISTVIPVRGTVLRSGEKRCSTCRLIKNLGEFYPKRRPPIGVSAWSSRCRPCSVIAAKKYSVKTDGRASRDAKYRARFGITLQQYNDMFAAQSGCCAVCGQHQSGFGQALAVDHDHKTHEIRGLLCHGCNTGIGGLKDSIEFLSEAIRYLKDPPARLAGIIASSDRKAGG